MTTGARQKDGSREIGPRTIALIGPYLSGKTTLLESLLFAANAVERKGSVTQGNSIGDASAEARSHRMSTDLNVARIDYLGEALTLLDCPGSIEFLQETLSVLPGVDAAVLVCDTDPAKALSLQPYFKRLADLNIPTLVFVNKIDQASGDIHNLLQVLQPASARPLVLRQLPVMEQGIVTGYVDLVHERAYVYRQNAPSLVVPLNGQHNTEQLRAARFHLLEQLADYDDTLMEELLGDIEPPKDEVFTDLAREVAEGLIIPVLLGSAERDYGVRRLLKALRHDVPGPKATAARLGVASNGAVLRVLKTIYAGQGGKLSVARVLSGAIKDGQVVSSKSGHSARIGGLFTLMGNQTRKIAEAHAGETVALGRLEGIVTGDVLVPEKTAAPSLERIETLSPVYALAIAVADSKEEVKLTTGLAKLVEEDPSVRFQQNDETHQLILWGQGEIHLRVAAEKLASRYGLHISTNAPKVPYKEAIRKAIHKQRGRYKRQTGGHGQFGDVVLDIKPLPRGTGFHFTEEISGGVVPRNYFPAVEAGVRDALERGPLGFPVVDVSVTLIDGSYHTVDSSEMAFRTAGRIGLSDALPNCAPVLLEPVMHVDVHVPNESTARVNAIVSSRRGQILGFDARSGWPGWDTVRAELPQVELQNLIVELRSASQGVATYEFTFDHMAELTGKLAEDVMRSKAA